MVICFPGVLIAPVTARTGSAARSTLASIGSKRMAEGAEAGFCASVDCFVWVHVGGKSSAQKARFIADTMGVSPKFPLTVGTVVHFGKLCMSIISSKVSQQLFCRGAPIQFHLHTRNPKTNMPLRFKCRMALLYNLA